MALSADDMVRVMSSGTADAIMILNVIVSVIAAWRSHSAAKRSDKNADMLLTISNQTNGTLSDLLKQRDEANRQIAALISRNRGSDQ